jgi:hypothetical protein
MAAGAAMDGKGYICGGESQDPETGELRYDRTLEFAPPASWIPAASVLALQDPLCTQSPPGPKGVILGLLLLASAAFWIGRGGEAR